MSGFVFFAIIFFIVIPMIKNAGKSKSAKMQTHKPRSGARQQNWSQVQELLQQKIQEQASKKRDTQGHSTARRKTHQNLHSGDSDGGVFTDTHIARVRKRDQRDRSERNRIEAMLHSKNNTSIVREGNRGVDNWGKRGDGSSGGGFLFLILLGLVALFVVSKIVPDLWPEIMRALNIK